MKGGRNLRDMQEEKKASEAWVKPQPCIICNKVIGGYYGSWEDGWTCNSACEKVQAAKPRYPNHSEEDFLKRFGDTHGSETEVCA